MSYTLFIMDEESSAQAEGLNALSFANYLRDFPKLGQPRPRVINLCDTDRYLSQGYYCSLLAEARNHQIIPSAKVINALRSGSAVVWCEPSLLERGSDTEAREQSMVVCMGDVAIAGFAKLARFIFRQYPAPILTINCVPEATGFKVTVHRGSLASLSDDDKEFCLRTLQTYVGKNWRSAARGKSHRWELAMLVDPLEKVPPSNRGALSQFEKAGEKLGINVHPVTSADLGYLDQYDALFIRETTAINHHTYRLAEEAEQRGLVVIDDPSSILRCCNKVFLHDAFSYKRVPSLKTLFLSDDSSETLDGVEAELGYPMVLKTPEGSFSKGVLKASTRQELEQIAAEQLSESALVLVQEYLFTEFDWRIGVLNGRPLYACRYYMARNHWQIYNHTSRRHFTGGFDTIPTFEVPSYVLKAALKAAKVVGNGLYGIDLKTDSNRTFVLEVNDNPSIDHGIEDAYLGKELYMEIMSEFLRRLESRGR